MDVKMYLKFIFYALFVGMVSSLEAGRSGCCMISETIQPKEKLTVEEAFRKAGIVHDYIPVPPRDLLKGGFEDLDIPLGVTISPLSGMGKPRYFSYPNAVEGDLYSIFYLDIDAPSSNRPTERAKIHLLTVNLPGDKLKSNDLHFGDIVVPYTPLLPEVNTGLHRYLGLAYKQQGPIDVNTPDLIRLTRNPSEFSVVDFANQYGLGEPLAGNFFYSEYKTCDHK